MSVSLEVSVGSRASGPEALRDTLTSLPPGQEKDRGARHALTAHKWTTTPVDLCLPNSTPPTGNTRAVERLTAQYAIVTVPTPV
jgi:hypothetical protein